MRPLLNLPRRDRMLSGMRIAVACGGTGGHIFPGLATAEVLRERGHAVQLWLSGRDVESSSLAQWDGPVVRVSAAGFPSGFSLRAFAVAARLARACGACWWRMRRERPDVLLAMGSYSSVGPGVAARLLGVPLVLHEANAVPGKAIALLARGARAVAVTSEAAGRAVRTPGRVSVTGFPVRRSISAAGAADCPAPNPVFTLLVTGGSQGAHRLNDAATDAVCRLHAAGERLEVIHLTGRQDEAAVRAAYAAAGVPHTVYAFCADMAGAYRRADYALTRAGAATCAELAICGVPALLVPLPTAARDHQTRNAEVLAAAGAADMIPEAGLEPEHLAGHLRSVMRAPERRARMRAALRGFAQPGAAALLADEVERAAARS